MVQDITGYPSPLPGRLGGLDLAIGSGCGDGGGDGPASLAASANYQSLQTFCTAPAPVSRRWCVQTAEEQCYYRVTCLVTL